MLGQEYRLKMGLVYRPKLRLGGSLLPFSGPAGLQRYQLHRQCPATSDLYLAQSCAHEMASRSCLCMPRFKTIL